MRKLCGIGSKSNKYYLWMVVEIYFVLSNSILVRWDQKHCIRLSYFQYQFITQLNQSVSRKCSVSVNVIGISTEKWPRRF